MRAASTTGDIGVGICCCHDDCIHMTGLIVSGSSDAYIENISAARTGDIVVGGCGHVGILVGGSSNIFIDNSKYKIGVGDIFVGCFTGTIVTGKNSTIISD